MKYYVFLTANIYLIGGMQNYVSGKAAYLKSHGWNVKIFFCGKTGEKCVIPFLNNYIEGETEELEKRPGEWTRRIREKTLNRMIYKIDYNPQNVSDIIIESQTDVLALWGELLAERIHAKHVCFICNEVFEGAGKYYSEHLKFFDFKFERRELAGIHEKSLGMLFGAYKEIPMEKQYHFYAANEGPVQEVDSIRVDQLKKCDWNICYIGCASKPYVFKIINDVEKLAKKYHNISIQFIMVGNASCRRNQLKERLQPLENISVSLLGDMVPIPRKLFEKLDVVIAGSGSADCAAREGVPTIVGDANNDMANGILGYTTFDTLFYDGLQQMDFDEALEQVLVGKVQNRLEFKLPPKYPASYYYKQHMQFVANSSKNQEYYINILENTSINYMKVLKYNLRHTFPGLAKWYKKFRNIFGKANKEKGEY